MLGSQMCLSLSVSTVCLFDERREINSLFSGVIVLRYLIIEQKINP